MLFNPLNGLVLATAEAGDLYTMLPAIINARPSAIINGPVGAAGVKHIPAPKAAMASPVVAMTMADFRPSACVLGSVVFSIGWVLGRWLFD